MGYRDESGVYRHPSRTVIFVGDFVDRGPHQRQVVELARSMVEDGAARAVMGRIAVALRPLVTQVAPPTSTASASISASASPARRPLCPLVWARGRPR